MRVFAATANAGKLRELRQIFAGVFEIDVPPDYVAPAEGDVSYAENAALKARALAASLRARGIRAAVIADDSGLEVRALRGAPGIYSARYGGETASWASRRHAILRTLEAMKARDRSARFVCAIHFIGADGSEATGFGTVEGEIAPEERGDGGFSYDAIFLLPALGLTFAQLSEEEKNRISHRAKAAAGLVAELPTRDGAPRGVLQSEPSGGT